jgi:hypothetical protein
MALLLIIVSPSYDILLDVVLLIQLQPTQYPKFSLLA